MQETNFIQQNHEKWREFEEVLKSPQKDPERLTDLFIASTDDLSYSRTYYPNRSVRVYLNGLAQQVYQAIYKNRAKEKNFFKHFWHVELPQTMWHNRQALVLSFLLFALGLTIGITSSIHYPDFAKIVLGEQYIEMTEANIKKGDPMAVYKNDDPFLMFLQIGWNNIRIAFGTFVLGIFFGLGTIYVILFNSIMVGAFIYFFIERSLFKESFLAIMLHGTLELSMIVLAGCAGFALAKGLLFPGTLSRSKSLIQSARSGIKILIAVVIFLTYASVIESFATRHSDMPDIIRGGIIVLSAMLVIGYFVWFPRKLYKEGKIGPMTFEESSPTKPSKIVLDSIKPIGKIFTESFSVFSKHLRTITYFALISATVITLYYGFATGSKYHLITAQSFLPTISQLLYPFCGFNAHLNFEKYPLLFLLIAVLFTVLSRLVIQRSHQALQLPLPKWNLLAMVKIFVIVIVAMLPLLLPHVFTLLVMWFWFPTTLLWLYRSAIHDESITVSLSNTLSLIKGNFTKMCGLFLTYIGIQWLIYPILVSDITEFVGYFIQINYPYNAVLANEIPYIVSTFFKFFVPAIVLTLPVIGTVLFYYSAVESNEAPSLLRRISQVDFKKSAYGLEKEM